MIKYHFPNVGKMVLQSILQLLKTTIMKALSIKNPYAQLIFEDLKPIEIRSKPIYYRGDILICASLKPIYIWQMSTENEISEQLLQKIYLNAGHAIGIVTVTGCRLMVKDDEKLAWCKFEDGSYAWMLSNPRRIVPFSVKGQLGLFNVEISQ